MRNASLAARKKDKVTGRINADWDRWFLDALTANDLDALFAIDTKDMEDKAGNGAHELRTWIAAAGAWHRPLRTMAWTTTGSPAWAASRGSEQGRTRVGRRRVRGFHSERSFAVTYGLVPRVPLRDAMPL